jgi:O-methyltransferase
MVPGIHKLHRWLTSRRKPSRQQLSYLAPIVRNADAAFRDGRFSEVIDMLEAAKPLSAEAHYLVGRSYFELGLRQEALKSFRRALLQQPSLADTIPALAVLSDRRTFSAADADILLPNFSLPASDKIAARRFLDKVAAPNLSTVYSNDNIIVFQRALTFLKDSKFMGSLFRASENNAGAFDDRTWRAHILVWAARNALTLDGDFVELGTFRGYFASCVAECLEFEKLPRNYYLYDTFAGLPSDAVREKDLPDSFYESLQTHYSEPDIYQSVVSRFKQYPNVQVVQGKVPDTLHERCPEKIAFLHIDLNSARHEIAALEYLWDRIVPGAVIVLDDFGFAIFRAQTQAHQEFFGGRGCSIAELPTGQGLVIKSR